MNRKMIVAVGLSAALCLSACGGGKKEADQVSASAEKPAEPAAETTAPASTDTTAPAVTSTTATLPSDPPVGPGGPVDASDAVFIAQGNALCARFTSQAESVAQPTDTTPAAIGAYLDSLLTLFHQQLGELKALTPTPGLAGRWAAILTTLEAEGATIESVVVRLKAGDTSAMSDIEAGTTDDINTQFDAIGMTTCGSDSGT